MSSWNITDLRGSPPTSSLTARGRPRVGVPDERFGEIVVGLVERAPGAALDGDDLIRHVKARLASHKAPKRIVTVSTIGRAATGKVDYRRLRAEAIRTLKT